MVAQRVMSSNYLGIGLAIATGVAASLAASLQAQAQNLNLQTQIDITSPPVTRQAVPAVSVPSERAALVGCPPGSERLKMAAKKIRSLLSTKNAKDIGDFQDGADLLEALHSGNLEKFLSEHPEVCAQAVPPQIPRPTLNKNGQSTTVLINSPLNPTYETDVLKAENNSSPGVSAGFGGNLLITTGGLQGRPFDLVAFVAGSASARYPAYSLKSLDTATGEAAYQFYIDGYQYDHGKQQYLTPDTPSSVAIQAQNMITIDTLALALLDQAGYTAGYHTEQANLLTPEIILSKQNMDLDDPKLGGCFSGNDAAFCHYANFSLTLGQTFSDVLSQQNANVAGSATLGWRIDPTWTLSLQTAATARAYEDFVGGRQDLLLQGGPMLAYVSRPIMISTVEMATVSFSLPITYFKNYSTVSSAAWSGLVIMPTLTVAFSYTPTAKPGP
jgi:hypothetical protein